MPKISIITPSVRSEMMVINKRCLERQTLQNFEWIIISPLTTIELDRQLDHYNYVYVPDPPKREGDFYRLDGAWNAGFKVAQGELLISIVDGIYFDPDTLEKFWFHYQSNPNACVTGIGHQYAELRNGKPEIEVWHDPRVRKDSGTWYEINPIDCEWVCTSLPRQAIYDIGGMDEDYDKVAALGEKDASIRMDKLGYKFYIDQTIEYRALHHPRLSADWDKYYQKGTQMFTKKVEDLNNGIRPVKLDFLG